MEGLERGVVPHGHEGALEERGADGGAAAADEAVATPPSRLACPGGEAGESVDLAAAEGAELRQLGDQRAGDGVPDAGHGREQVLLLPPGRRAASSFLDVPVVRSALDLPSLQTQG